jgi:hypothetical protein
MVSLTAALKVATGLGCLVLFSLQFASIFSQYFEKKMTMTIEEIEYDSLVLPSISICIGRGGTWSFLP